MDAPFPWFGGKRRIATLVWERFGDAPNYVEPFFGSGAVLLGRPTPPKIETVNDADGYVANFWRAVAHDPEAVARWADAPVNENDLHARHAWLVERRAEFVRKLEGSPDYYDAKVAGWWVWGLCCWIGSGWCSGKGPWHSEGGELVRNLGDAGKGVKRQLPHLGDAGNGVNRKLPHLGSAGNGVNRKLPHLGSAGQGVLMAWMQALADRLRKTRVCCGDWTRIMGQSVTTNHGITAILLDPPYDGTRCANVYAEDSNSIFANVATWAAEHGNDPKMRIALCGYEGSWTATNGWTEVPWKARGGYGSQGNGDGRANSSRERIWFSPACLQVEQQQCA